MAVPGQQTNTGSFVDTSSNITAQQIYSANVNSEEFKYLLVRLAESLEKIQVNLNTREAAFYVLEEFLTGQLWHNPNSTNPLNQRQGFRKVVTATSLTAGTTNLPHGLTIGSTWKFTNITGAATLTTTPVAYPLPYASNGANDIVMRVDATNVIIENNSGIAFDDVEVVLEYVKF